MANPPEKILGFFPDHNNAFPSRMPEGRLPVHGIGAINTNASIEEAAKIAQGLNSPENIKRVLYGPEVLDRIRAEAGNVISFVDPTAPYTPRAVMITLHNESEIDDLSSQTRTVFDYSVDAQTAYFATILAGVNAMIEMVDDPNFIVLYVENGIKVITSEQHRTSRTINPTHGHFIEIDPKAVHESTASIEHLENEQKIMRRKKLLEAYVKRVFDEMAPKVWGIISGHDINIRNLPPLGYSFDLPSDPSIIQHVMEAHFNAATKVGNDYLRVAKARRLDVAKVIPPASYRLFVGKNDGGFRFLISPEFVSNAGPLEAMGIFLHRSPDHPKKYSDEEAFSFRKEFVEKTIEDQKAFQA